MVYFGRSLNGALLLKLEMMSGIPGNGVAYPGQELTGCLHMYMCMIPPTPKEGRQETIDHLLDRYVTPHADETQIEAAKEVLDLYRGLEADTIFCLSYALQGGRFDQASARFREFYERSLSKRNLPDWMRCTSEETFEFFHEMGNFVEAKKYS